MNYELRDSVTPTEAHKNDDEWFQSLSYANGTGEAEKQCPPTPTYVYTEEEIAERSKFLADSRVKESQYMHMTGLHNSSVGKHSEFSEADTLVAADLDESIQGAYSVYTPSDWEMYEANDNLNDYDEVFHSNCIPNYVLGVKKTGEVGVFHKKYKVSSAYESMKKAAEYDNRHSPLLPQIVEWYEDNIGGFKTTEVLSAVKINKKGIVTLYSIENHQRFRVSASIKKLMNHYIDGESITLNWKPMK